MTHSTRNRHGSKHASEVEWPIIGRTVAECPDCGRPRRARGEYPTPWGMSTYFHCDTPTCDEDQGICDVDLALEWDESWDNLDGYLVIFQHEEPAEEWER